MESRVAKAIKHIEKRIDILHRQLNDPNTELSKIPLIEAAFDELWKIVLILNLNLRGA